tara:strand:+ start:79 stop:1308 length:1230 start_codon:yes stop_codon:yes gene_type:complete
MKEETKKRTYKIGRGISIFFGSSFFIFVYLPVSIILLIFLFVWVNSISVPFIFSGFGLIATLIVFILIARVLKLWIGVSKRSLIIILSPWVIVWSFFSFFSIADEINRYHTHSKAKGGDAGAQYLMGNTYAFGDHDRMPLSFFHQNYKKAIEWYQLSVNQEHPLAQNELGIIYYEGRGVTKNIKEALNLFQLSGENGNFESQLYLGWIYYQGLGVPKDEQKAFKWLLLALKEEKYLKKGYNIHLFNSPKKEHSYPSYRNWWVNYSDYSLVQKAENALGKIYEKGRVVQQDYKEAFKWYERAKIMSRGFVPNNAHQCWLDCDHNVSYPEALYNLGLMYAKGHGVSKDYVIAHSFFNSAATFGEHESSKNWLNKLEKEMTPQQIEEAKIEAMSMNGMGRHSRYTELKLYEN